MSHFYSQFLDKKVHLEQFRDNESFATSLYVTLDKAHLCAVNGSP